ncbi:glycosyltransferase family 2 protein [Streptomyces lonarensis]|uniref:Glycosyltransferase family 2 protein n=3 Tax=Streptomyces lonarensis TaxID=700599 RepID=A0A7X6D1L8_9ACTN|nr:glycosyltransferase family 2 protein [Streptomyces lonarensis]
MPYLVECLDSLFAQSLDPSRYEVIVVDDASDDGSELELRRRAEAHPNVRLIRRDVGSGGPSAPRNQGMDLAAGRFVFLMDADDMLGEKALELMLEAADRDNSDMVLGKLVGVGRSTSVKAYAKSGKVDLYASEIYRALSPQKLYRRSVLTDHGIRFDESLWWGEDQVFVTEFHLVSGGTSVVGDYDCYYLRQRDDGGNIMQRSRNVEEVVRYVETLMDLVADGVDDGAGRTRLLGRHFRTVAQDMLPVGLTHPDAAFRAEVWRRARTLHARHWAPEIQGELPAYESLQLRLLADDDIERATEVARRSGEASDAPIHFEDGRAYRRYPYFRSAEQPLPDEYFDVTDRLRLKARLLSSCWDDDLLRLTGDCRVTGVDLDSAEAALVLRHRENGSELRVDADPAPHGTPGTATRWHAAVDPAAVDPAAVDPAAVGAGVWDAYLAVRFHGMDRTVRLSAAPDTTGLAVPAGRLLATPAGGVGAVPYVTTSRRFSLDIGGTHHPVTAGAVVTDLSWQDDRLTVTGAAWLAHIPGDLLHLSLALRPREPRPAPRAGLGTLRRLIGGRPPQPPTEPLAAVVADLPLTAAVPTAPATAGPRGFTAALDLTEPGATALVTRAVWDVWLTIESGGRHWDVRPKPAPAPVFATPPEIRHRPRHARGVTTLYTTKGGYLALDGPGEHFPTTG